MIDRVEVGWRVSPRLGVAFEVADAQDITNHLVRAGADLLAPPTRTPWGSLNSRLDAPGGLHITVFEDLASGGAIGTDLSVVAAAVTSVRAADVALALQEPTRSASRREVEISAKLR